MTTTTTPARRKRRFRIPVYLAPLLGVVAVYAVGGVLCLIAAQTPCASEDATFCIWNAETSGNGAGRSFIALTPDVTIYLD